jgi:hypothetical protein
VTPRPGVSALELLRELREALAMISATEQKSAEALERAAVLRKAAASRLEMVEERLAKVLREAEAVEFPPARPSRRPRLEEGSPHDRERAEKVIAALERDPEQSDHRIAVLTGVHHQVVARIRRDHFRGKSRGKSPNAQKVRGKPSPRERPS